MRGDQDETMLPWRTGPEDAKLCFGKAWPFRRGGLKDWFLAKLLLCCLMAKSKSAFSANSVCKALVPMSVSVGNSCLTWQPGYFWWKTIWEKAKLAFNGFSASIWPSCGGWRRWATKSQWFWQIGSEKITLIRSSCASQRGRMQKVETLIVWVDSCVQIAFSKVKT